MSYDMNQEPGHRELVESVTHIDLAQYQPGTEHYERLTQAMETAQKYQWPRDGWEVNL